MNQKLQTKPLGAVTGASSGIGYELAKEFARNGFDLVVVAENEGIHEIVYELEELGAKAISVQANLGTRRGVEKFYRAIRDTGRPLEAIAMNAGVGFAGEFAESDLEEQLSCVNLNCASLVHLSRLIVPDMVARGQGRILITSSIASKTPGPYMTVYHASKAFDQLFALGLRVELEDKGVTVTALLPGPTQTEFFEKGHMEDTKIGVSEKDLPEDVAREGFSAMIAGKDQVVAGRWKNTADVLLARLAPETIKAKMTGADAKPGSAHKKH